jgi:hypothetical protein
LHGENRKARRRNDGRNPMDKIQSMFEKEVTGSRNVPGKSCNVALHKYQLPNVRDENLLHGDVKYE